MSLHSLKTELFNNIVFFSFLIQIGIWTVAPQLELRFELELGLVLELGAIVLEPYKS